MASSPQTEKTIPKKIRRVLTKEQRIEQLVSFAYGNAGIENPSITKQMVQRVVMEREAARDAES